MSSIYARIRDISKHFFLSFETSLFFFLFLETELNWNINFWKKTVVGIKRVIGTPQCKERKKKLRTRNGK